MIDYFRDDIVSALKANTPVPPRRLYDLVVRIVDVLVAGLGLLILSPFFCLIALATKLQDGGPVFFRQERMGKVGKPFFIIKFRTMVVNAEQVGQKWRIEKNDKRVTRIGKILREFHLDEFPQLINVLQGEMSLVGPRPALVFQKDYYDEWEMARLAVPPGMTGLSQVSGGNALNWDQRILIDVYYVRHRKFIMFCWILIQTFIQIFVKKGIYTKEGNVTGWTRPVPDWYKNNTTTTASTIQETSYHA